MEGMREQEQESANAVRRKKRKRVSAFRFYFFNILLGVVIAGIVLVLVVAFFFNVEKVSVSGCTLYSDQEIEEMVLSGKHSGNTVYMAVKNLIKPRRDIPFVDKVTVRLSSYNSLRLIVKEKRPIGYVPEEEGKYAYFDSQGRVIQVSERILEGVMEVRGLRSGAVSEGESLDIKKEQADYLLHLLSLLDKYELSPAIVTFTEQGGVILTDGELLISLGKENDLDGKIQRLPYVLPSLEGKTGTLHLENWSEENTDIVFRE